MIRPGDGAAKEEASRRWDSIAKPLHSLGKLERDIIRIAGIQRTAAVRLEKKALLVLCADNGVVEEGVTQTGQEVTAIVAEKFLTGNTSAAIMAKKAGVDLFPIYGHGGGYPGAGLQGGLRHPEYGEGAGHDPGAGPSGGAHRDPAGEREERRRI